MSAPRTSAVALERVTPRIDALAGCRCRRPIVWDELLGWLHLAAGSSTDRSEPPHVPAPVHRP